MVTSITGLLQINDVENTSNYSSSPPVRTKEVVLCLWCKGHLERRKVPLCPLTPPNPTSNSSALTNVSREKLLTHEEEKEAQRANHMCS